MKYGERVLEEIKKNHASEPEFIPEYVFAGNTSKNVPVYLIGIPITAAAGLLLHMSVPATYLIMYLVEDVFKVFVYGKHLISNKWIRPVVKAPIADA